MSDLHVVILAAGKGTRMKSSRPKVLHQLAGRSLIAHVLATAAPLNAESTVIVVGHGAAEVRAALAAWPDLDFVVQSPQLGTGHALLQTEPALAGRSGTALLLYADVPLLQPNTLVRLLERHAESKAAATVLTAEVANPEGYGRIVRDPGGQVSRIVEDRDASVAEREIREINSGIYALELSPLFDALKSLAADNAQGEYYLTDLVALYRQRGLGVDAFCFESAAELRGVNSRVDLAELAETLLDRKRRSVMLDGVTLEDPSTTYIEADVTIGEDTIVAAGVSLTGRTSIGARCRIHAGVRLTDAVVGDDVTILDHCVVVESSIGTHASIGPFTHLRPGCTVEEHAHLGNFVELKKTRFGARSKAGHLAYLGDALVGTDVNIGAGVITVNYDGVNKHQTVIEDGVCVGSDSQLMAPVKLGHGSFIAAGSSITEDVPPDALAVARSHQTTKPEWAAARRSARRNKA